ncbi:MAG TPA: hybrid sensor histidine kinase/response regulator [Paludibacter sp.]|nr:hybrid sensor histidine kinase/response regulator [Paludibacter sp.]
MSFIKSPNYFKKIYVYLCRVNIERKIRFKAVGLYIIAGVGAAVMLLFLYNVRSNIQSQRIEVEKQHKALALTNKLIAAVGEAQSSVSLFVSTHDTTYINNFGKKLLSVNSLMDTLTVIEPVGKKKLHQIRILLTRQTSNIAELNRQLGNENPLAAISKRIQQYKQKPNSNSHNATVKKDTLYKTSEQKKNFFRRLKEVFSPEKNTTVMVLHVDTIRNANASPILSEVKNMASVAGKRYEKNIRAIEQQVAQQITFDHEISTQISSLLLDFHRQTLNSVLGTIERREQAIKQNYTITIVGGIVALGLILLFILLIIYDVNKGKEARERIKEVMESRHKLLLSVSHDIKSPLGSILGYLELRRQEGEDIKSMQNSARHILAMLENLLEFSSLEQGSLQLNAGIFSLGGLSEEIGQMFMPLAEAKGLSFTFTSDAVRLNSDQMKIKQIIINLVSNAVKYTRSGEVALQMAYTGTQLCVEVRDTGAGIPEDKLEDMYKPFLRVERNNALAHGSGLGMYVVKGLVELLGGTIQVTSQVNKGTTVKVMVPCQEMKNKIKQGSKKIIVYDDDAVVAKMACDMLIRLGHKIVEYDCDMILTDMEMGKLSGLDVLSSAGGVPVIVMTGHSDFTAEKAAQLGFDGFLPKPFTMEALREIIGEGEIANESFLEDDDEEIREMFRTSTAENYRLLKKTLAENDFDRAQAICHKMLPMFVLLDYPAEALQQLDARRGNAYEGWQHDVETILSIKV